MLGLGILGPCRNTLCTAHLWELSKCYIVSALASVRVSDVKSFFLLVVRLAQSVTTSLFTNAIRVRSSAWVVCEVVCGHQIGQLWFPPTLMTTMTLPSGPTRVTTVYTCLRFHYNRCKINKVYIYIFCCTINASQGHAGTSKLIIFRMQQTDIL